MSGPVILQHPIPTPIDLHSTDRDNFILYEILCGLNSEVLHDEAGDTYRTLCFLRVIKAATTFVSEDQSPLLCHVWPNNKGYRSTLRKIPES